MKDTQAEEARALRALWDAFKAENKISQADFAKKYDLSSQSMVNQYLTGERPLNIGAATNFARGMEVSVNEFSPRLAREIMNAARYVSRNEKGESDEKVGTGNVRPAPPFKNRVVVVSWTSAGPWDEAVDPYSPGYGIGEVETDLPVHNRMIALIVKGTSMENPKGDPTFPDGCTIIVDGTLTPQPGQFIVVRQQDWDEAAFKKLEVHGGVQWLVPLNPQYQATQMPFNTHIVGVVVEMIPARKRFI